MSAIKNRSVAVIGGAGFLGSHLVNHLIEDKNCPVLVIDNLIAGRREFIHPKAKFEYHDITRSGNALRQLFLKYKIEFVFNYAAEPYIPVSFDHPLRVFDNNARGALIVMNEAQNADVEAILQVSSAEIYGDAPPFKIDETWTADPHSTYGASKLAIDGLVRSRWREASTPAIALRQFNCVGERETHEYVIPVIIEQVLKGDGTVYLGNDSFRDFQYAGDAVRMATELLEKGNFGEVYNMGSESGIKIYDLAKLIGKLCGKEVTVVNDPSKNRPWEIWHLESDNTKLYSTIEARPRVPLTNAIQRTIDDYKKNGFCFR
jgi:UDP-glucose 4-epimerase